MILKRGQAKQFAKAQEEAAEFIVAVAHTLDNRGFTTEQLIAETADLELMLEQVREMVGDEAVDRARGLKLARTVAKYELGDELCLS